MINCRLFINRLNHCAAHQRIEHDAFIVSQFYVDQYAEQQIGKFRIIARIKIFLSTRTSRELYYELNMIQGGSPIYYKVSSFLRDKTGDRRKVFPRTTLNHQRGLNFLLETVDKFSPLVPSRSLKQAELNAFVTQMPND